MTARSSARSRGDHAVNLHGGLVLGRQSERTIQHVGLRRCGCPAAERAEQSAEDPAEHSTETEVKRDRAERKHDSQNIEGDPPELEMKDLTVLSRLLRADGAIGG